MLTQLATVKARLALLPSDATYDDLLTRAIGAVSEKFDRECNRTFARTVGATQEFDAADTEIVARCYPVETVTKFELKTSEAEGWVEQTGMAYVVRAGCVISLSTPLSFLAQVSCAVRRWPVSLTLVAMSCQAPRRRADKLRCRRTLNSLRSNRSQCGSSSGTSLVLFAVGRRTEPIWPSSSCRCSRRSVRCSGRISGGLPNNGRNHDKYECERVFEGR